MFTEYLQFNLILIFGNNIKVKGHAYGISKVVNMNLVGNALLKIFKKETIKMIRKVYC